MGTVTTINKAVDKLAGLDAEMIQILADGHDLIEKGFIENDADLTALAEALDLKDLVSFQRGVLKRFRDIALAWMETQMEAGTLNQHLAAIDRSYVLRDMHEALLEGQAAAFR